MNDDAIIPQEPGTTPNTDTAALEAMLAGDLGDLLENLAAMTDAELEQLAAMERQGINRTLVLDALQRELEARALPPENEAPESTAEPIGDPVNYADKRAVEVDPRTLVRPVLTRDGWVLPLPSAKPEA